MSPDFIVIGGTKCGTTSLYHWMEAHPDLFLMQKEQRPLLRDQGDRDVLQAYAEAFAGAREEQLRGEFANGYTRDPVYPSPAARMARLFPDIRLVYLLRDPLKRIVSHYRHRLATGTEHRSPSDALVADPGYLAASLYGHQLSQYLRHFSPDSVFVGSSADMFENGGSFFTELSHFLGVRSIDHSPEPQNVSAERLIMPGFLRQLSRYERAKPWLRMLSRQPFMRAAGGPAASEATFVLPAAQAQKICDRLREDRALLQELAPTLRADWTLDPAQLTSAHEHRKDAKHGHS